jgi:hypothetical protein
MSPKKASRRRHDKPGFVARSYRFPGEALRNQQWENAPNPRRCAEPGSFSNDVANLMAIEHFPGESVRY